MTPVRYRTTSYDPRIEVAIPVELYHKLVRSARDSGRSLQTEFNIRLGRTFQCSDRQPEEDALIARLFSGSDDYSFDERV